MKSRKNKHTLLFYFSSLPLCISTALLRLVFLQIFMMTVIAILLLPNFFLFNLEPETLSRSPMRGREPRTRTIFCCFPRNISGELGSKQSSRDWNQHLGGMLAPWARTFPSEEDCNRWSLPPGWDRCSEGSSMAA